MAVAICPPSPMRDGMPSKPDQPYGVWRRAVVACLDQFEGHGLADGSVKLRTLSGDSAAAKARPGVSSGEHGF